ncbi:MAG: inorganic diphosphatase [Myxococcota bacterium]|nr:inorganic diphosphatase [Myxococcota bacterium]
MERLYTVIIETPKGAFIKRNEYGAIDLISPIPCPFNYGRLEGFDGKDGDPLDAIVLGKTRAYQERCRLSIVGRVLFIDRGMEDHKIILSTSPPSRMDRISLHTFFRFYARIKNLTNLQRKSNCRTAFLGLECKEIDLFDD